MEDYSPTQGEVEETPVERRRFLPGKFFESWLEESKEKKAKKAKAKEDNESKSWLPERLKDKFSNIFKGFVGLELVPAAATTETERPTEPIKFDDNVAEQLNDTDPTPKNQTEEGLLAVSADAQRRYYGYELTPEDPVQDEIDNSDIETDEVESKEPEANEETQEMTETFGPRNSVPAPEAAGFKSPNERWYGGASTTTPVGEVLRRQQAERLERQVNKIKLEAKSAKKEQQEIKKQQEDFAKTLDKQQKAQEKLEKITIPKMEKSRQELKKRLEEAPKPVKQETARTKATLPEKPEQKAAVKTEAKPVAPDMAELTRADHKVKPEQLRKTVEKAAEQNVPIESHYERRHEVKDTENNGITVSGGVANVRQPGQIPSIPPPIIVNQSPSSSPPTVNRASPKRSSIFTNGPDMYKQAAQAGFWSGIALTLFLLLILIITRL